MNNFKKLLLAFLVLGTSLNINVYAMEKVKTKVNKKQINMEEDNQNFWKKTSSYAINPIKSGYAKLPSLKRKSTTKLESTNKRSKIVEEKEQPSIKTQRIIDEKKSFSDLKQNLEIIDFIVKTNNRNNQLDSASWFGRKIPLKLVYFFIGLIENKTISENASLKTIINNLKLTLFESGKFINSKLLTNLVKTPTEKETLENYLNLFSHQRKNEILNQTDKQDFTLLALAVKANAPDNAKELIAHGTDLDKKYDKFQYNILHLIVINIKNLEKCFELLKQVCDKKGNTFINTQDKKQNTPLHYLVLQLSKKNTVELKTIVEKVITILNAKMDIPNENNLTVLEILIKNKQDKFVNDRLIKRSY